MAQRRTRSTASEYIRDLHKQQLSSGVIIRERELWESGKKVSYWDAEMEIDAVWYYAHPELGWLTLKGDQTSLLEETDFTTAEEAEEAAAVAQLLSAGKETA